MDIKSRSARLTIARLKNLDSALRHATACAERSAEKDPGVLDTTFVSRLEDIEMEVGMLLADLEDGSFVKSTG
jgi:hypothetical protein